LWSKGLRARVSDDTTAATRRTPVQIESRAQYEALVADHPLVLLEFTTPGCGICASMEPVLGVVARAAPGVVAVVSAPDVPELARSFDVRTAPTLVVLRDGEEVDRLDEGFQSADRLVEVLETHAD
jgi:thioredoxin-like negative regulator of GroEL